MLPNRRKMIDKAKATQHRQVAQNTSTIANALITAINGNRFNWSEKSRRIIGGMIAWMPKISSLAWEQIFPFIFAAFCEQINVNYTFAELAAAMPSRVTIENLLYEFAAESTMCITATLNRTKSYFLSHNKGESLKELVVALSLF